MSQNTLSRYPVGLTPVNISSTLLWSAFTEDSTFTVDCSVDHYCERRAQAFVDAAVDLVAKVAAYPVLLIQEQYTKDRYGQLLYKPHLHLLCRTSKANADALCVQLRSLDRKANVKPSPLHWQHKAHSYYTKGAALTQGSLWNVDAALPSAPKAVRQGQASYYLTKERKKIFLPVPASLWHSFDVLFTEWAGGISPYSFTSTTTSPANYFEALRLSPLTPSIGLPILSFALPVLGVRPP